MLGMQAETDADYGAEPYIQLAAHAVDVAPAQVKGAKSQPSNHRQRQKNGLPIHVAQAAADSADAAEWASLMAEELEAGAG